MAADKEATFKKYCDIQKEFNRLCEIKEFGVPKFSNAFMIAKVANKFYLSNHRIEQILKMDLNPNQKALDL